MKMQDETTYKLFKAIEANPATNQFQLSDKLGIGLGKLDYCHQALLNKCLDKAEYVMISTNKRGYIYKFTPAGLSEKALVSLRFLCQKENEYDELQHEIAILKQEVNIK